MDKSQRAVPYKTFHLLRLSESEKRLNHIKRILYLLHTECCVTARFSIVAASSGNCKSECLLSRSNVRIAEEGTLAAAILQIPPLRHVTTLHLLV